MGHIRMCQHHFFHEMGYSQAEEGFVEYSSDSGQPQKAWNTMFWPGIMESNGMGGSVDCPYVLPDYRGL